MIYLMRHGETEWNVEGRFQGQDDSPLTARGREQAERVGRRLAADLGPFGGPLPASVSPLGRTQATAAIVGRHVPLAVTIEPLIMEIAFGAWEGRLRHDILAEVDARGGERPVDWAFSAPGGESYERAAARAASFLAKAEAPLVVITHGQISRLIRGLYAALPIEAMMALTVPQDGYFRLAEGKVDFIPA